MTYRPAAIIAVTLTLTGCAMPNTPGPQHAVNGVSATPEFAIHGDYKYWMNTIGGPSGAGVSDDQKQASGTVIETRPANLDPGNGALRAGLLGVGLGLLWVAWSMWRRPKRTDLW